MKIIKKTLLTLYIATIATTGMAQAANDTTPVPVEVFDAPVSAPHFAKFMSAGPLGMMMHRLSPPMVIMHHQEELGLTAKQIDSIKKEMKAFQSETVDIQWDLYAAQSALEKELGNEKIDLQASLQAMDKVLDAKNRMKRQKLAMLIKIHNLLTPEQREKLKALHPMPFGGPFKRDFIDKRK